MLMYKIAPSSTAQLSTRPEESIKNKITYLRYLKVLVKNNIPVILACIRQPYKVIQRRKVYQSCEVLPKQINIRMYEPRKKIVGHCSRFQVKTIGRASPPNNY